MLLCETVGVPHAPHRHHGAQREEDDTEQAYLVSFVDKDDVLTLLVHLGYLAYNQNMQYAYIPNEEIRQELLFAVRRKKWSELNLFLQDSEELLDATLDMDEEATAEKIEKIHTEYVSAIQYNNENSLS